MENRDWQIAIFGTFDVENYGDLLFPIIAQAELSKRLGTVRIHSFSYHARTPPEWPYAVTSVTELPAIAGRLDGVLIGGGFIIRFDKVVAAGYGPPAPEIHHPTGYWLSPALIALQHGVPLIWNAPGMHCNDIPGWAQPLIRMALEHSSYIGVRDELSRDALAPFANDARINVLPDTAFGISRVIDQTKPSPEFTRLRELCGLSGPYIVVHAIRGLEGVLRMIKGHAELFRYFRILVLPIGPVLGDHESIVDDDLPNAVRLPYWPQPLLLAEFISQACAVVGHSYHLMITALAFGVPVFSSADLSRGKYTAMLAFDTVFPLPKDKEIDPGWFIERLGKKIPSPAAGAARDQLAEYWDRVAAILQKGLTETQRPLNRFWQSLPGLLESASDESSRLNAALDACQVRVNELAGLLTQSGAENEAASARSRALNSECLEARLRVDELSGRLAQADREIEAATAQSRILNSECLTERMRTDELSRRLAEADAKITALLNSRSVRVTAPLRAIMHTLKRLSGK